MFSFFKKIFFAFVFVQISLTQVMAQDSGQNILDETVRDGMTVAGLGAAGAVLGLSTLSFVDEPKDHLKNIVVGAAIGIILGVGVVAWTQASKSKEIYEVNVPQKDFSTKERVAWYQSDIHQVHETSSLQSFNFKFNF